jgi:hypothetical protein
MFPTISPSKCAEGVPRPLPPKATTIRIQCARLQHPIEQVGEFGVFRRRGRPGNVHTGDILRPHGLREIQDVDVDDLHALQQRPMLKGLRRLRTHPPGTPVRASLHDDTEQLVTGTFADYAMLRAAHAPSVIAEFTETLSPFNPLGAKGVGEAGTVGTPPALANAVMDALAPLGIRHVDLPLTGETLWRLMQDATQEGSPGLVSKPRSSHAGPQRGVEQ